MPGVNFTFRISPELLEDVKRRYEGPNSTVIVEDEAQLRKEIDDDSSRPAD